MPLILNIDTSTETASICLSKEDVSLFLSESTFQKDHASWLHVTIEKEIKDSGYKIGDLEAIAVSNGPGSYTGLRVGMAAAKGLCYALDIPLITENTLKIMAFAAKEQASTLGADLICPMIDARRMDVFTALYTLESEQIMAPLAITLTEGSFKDFLSLHSILFLGSGIKKWMELVQNNRVFFMEAPPLASYLGHISYQKYVKQDFTDLFYSEPLYVKEFYTHEKK